MLPFNASNFGFLSTAQYNSELDKAEARAYYILSTPASKAKNPGWGISIADLDADESGQLQVALELLTAAEFLKRLHGLYPDYAGIGSYSDPSGESLSLSVEQLEALLKQADVIKNKAYEAALPYIDESVKNQGAAIVTTNYDFETLEIDYLDNVYPKNPLDYKLTKRYV